MIPFAIATGNLVRAVVFQTTSVRNPRFLSLAALGPKTHLLTVPPFRLLLPPAAAKLRTFTTAHNPRTSRPVLLKPCWSQSCILLPLNTVQNQALGLLVPASSIHYCTYTAGLSPGSLPGALLPLRNGNLCLEVGFTLRCLQRLSGPHFASLLCAWQRNSCTSGASTPVLSY